MDSVLTRAARNGVSHIASQTGLSRSYIGRVLAGSRTPSPDKAEVIAKYFGMSVSRLYEEIRTIRDRRGAA